MITLTDKNGRAIQLNDHLVWVDWGQYSPVAQAKKYTIDGSMTVEATRKKAGMPITLSAEPNQGLKYRKDVIPINEMMLANIDSPMTLKLHDESTYNVLFSSEEAAPIEAVPLIPYADPISSDYIGLILDLLKLKKKLRNKNVC